MTSFIISARRLADVGAETRCSLLVRDQSINPPKKDFGGPIAPELAAKWTPDYRIVSREGVELCRHVAFAELAAHHPVRRERSPQLGVVHAHGEILGQLEGNSSAVVVDRRGTTSGCVRALEMVQEVYL